LGTGGAHVSPGSAALSPSAAGAPFKAPVIDTVQVNTQGREAHPTRNFENPGQAPELAVKTVDNRPTVTSPGLESSAGGVAAGAPIELLEAFPASPATVNESVAEQTRADFPGLQPALGGARSTL
jgi:hypothetical protein